MTITVTPLSKSLGAEIGGIDTRQSLAMDEIEAIEQAFLDHMVLRIRGQALSVRELAAFSGHFGELQPHVQRKFQHPEDPNVVEMRNYGDDGKFNLAAASRGSMERLRDGWHSDLSQDSVPAKATLLHALEIPDHGGNTVFTDTHATYETLPDAAKKRIAGLRAEFSYGGNTRKKSTGMAANSLDKDGQENTTVTHPVV